MLYLFGKHLLSGILQNISHMTFDEPSGTRETLLEATHVHAALVVLRLNMRTKWFSMLYVIAKGVQKYIFKNTHIYIKRDSWI